MSEPTPGDLAIVLLRKLLEGASWYHSAIELDFGVDGEDARVEAEAIVKAADLLTRETTE